jgi:O-6-methylguanine DNA methyltransferase
MKIPAKRAKSLAAKPLWVEMLPTPLCPLWLSFSEHGLQTLHFNSPGPESGPLWPVGQSDQEVAAHLRQWRQEVAGALKAYFAGEPRSFDNLTLDLQGTPFQIMVWTALRQVPFGTIISYQALAGSLDRPRSARAIGGALGANPLPIIIPCHRVIAANGSLGGYSAGLHYKRQLLSHEQAATGKSPIPLHGPIEDR